MKILEVIEDSHGLLNKKIELTERCLWCDPVRGWDAASEIEERLIRLNKPYVLAEIETTTEGFYNGLQFIRGYGIFTEKEEG